MVSQLMPQKEFLCSFRTRIGVFFCGPKTLSSTLHALSNEHSSDDLTSTQFVFNEENF